RRETQVADLGYDFLEASGRHHVVVHQDHIASRSVHRVHVLDKFRQRRRIAVCALQLGHAAAADLMALIKEQPGYDEIQKAVRKAGGLHDPIVVSHDGLVIEGNTRTAAVKTLHAGNPSDARWHSIPVARLPKTVPERSIAMLMASYHVAGKTVWRPYAQAD